ncbi:hypothetical protein RKD41_003159 [Streptomyces tendae]
MAMYRLGLVEHAAVVLEELDEEERQQEHRAVRADQRLAVALEFGLVPGAEEADALVVQLHHHGEEHREPGEQLDDELPQFGEGVRPETADGAVHGGDDPGDEDALVQRDAGEHRQQGGDRRPLGAHVHDLQQHAGPGQRLLGPQVVTGFQILQRGGHVQP